MKDSIFTLPFRFPRFPCTHAQAWGKHDENIVIIHFPMFSHYEIHVEVSENFRETANKYSALKNTQFHNDPKDSAGCATTVKSENRCYILLKPKADVNTIVHEAWHAVSGMLNHLAISLDDETACYCIGFVTESIDDFVNRPRRSDVVNLDETLEKKW